MSPVSKKNADCSCQENVITHREMSLAPTFASHGLNFANGREEKKKTLLMEKNGPGVCKNKNGSAWP